MPSSATSQSSSPSPTTGQSSKQEQLISYCRSRGLRSPSWQVLSDRRGGRTAWSCTVQVNGQYIAARYWYDGQYVNSAREDAAERALQALGELPAPAGPQPAHFHQQQQQQQRTAHGAGIVGILDSGKEDLSVVDGRLDMKSLQRVAWMAKEEQYGAQEEAVFRFISVPVFF